MRIFMSSGILTVITALCTLPVSFNPLHLNVSRHVTKPTEIASGDKVIDLLTKGAWKMHTLVSDKPCDSDGDGKLTLDMASELPACAKDDVMYIKANGKLVFERFKRCDPAEGAIEDYNWKMTDNNQFVISKGSMQEVMLFKYVTNEQLVMVIPSEAHGVMYYFTVTYRRA